MSTAAQATRAGAIHARLWAVLEADAAFAALVRERNRVRLLSYVVEVDGQPRIVAPRGFKPNLGADDVPEVVIAQGAYASRPLDPVVRHALRSHTYTAAISVNGLDMDTLNAVRDAVLRVWEAHSPGRFALPYVLGTAGIDGQDLITNDDQFRGAGRNAGNQQRLVSLLSIGIEYRPE